jgi:GntR family transcriptional repressor for pyruvate dehydrogenase complex
LFAAGKGNLSYWFLEKKERKKKKGKKNEDKGLKEGAADGGKRKKLRVFARFLLQIPEKKHTFVTPSQIMLMEDIFSKIGTTQTLSQKIERRIEEAIIQRKLIAGNKLPSEKELCASFAVSRTALREALRRLNARGLIEIKKGSGMYISEICIEDAVKSLNLYYDLKFDSNLIAQMIEMRLLFEPQIARLAARNRTEEDLKILSENLADLEACNPDNTQLEADTINRFHTNITKATGNPMIVVSMEPIFSLLPRMRNFLYANIDGEKNYTLESQRKILEAIRVHDDKAAHDEMRTLLRRNHEVYDLYFKSLLAK